MRTKLFVLFYILIVLLISASLPVYGAYQPRTEISGTVVVSQGSSPWIVSGSLGLSGIGSVSVMNFPSLYNVSNTSFATAAHQVTQSGYLGSIDGATSLLSLGLGVSGTSASSYSYVMSGNSAGQNRDIKVDSAGELQVDVLSLPVISIGAISTTGVLAVSSTGNVPVDLVNQEIFSIGAVSTTASFNGAVTGVSTTNQMLVSIAAVSTTIPVSSTGNVPVDLVNQEGFSLAGVSTTTPLNIALTSISTTGVINGSIMGVSTTAVLNVSQSNIIPDLSASTSISRTDLANFAFAVSVQNLNRRGLEIMNTSDVNCWVKLGTAPTSVTSTIYLSAYGGYYLMSKPIYTGAINGICSASATTGALTVTERL